MTARLVIPKGYHQHRAASARAEFEPRTVPMIYSDHGTDVPGKPTRHRMRADTVRRIAAERLAEADLSFPWRYFSGGCALMVAAALTLTVIMIGLQR